jgi:hypothetical protein
LLVKEDCQKLSNQERKASQAVVMGVKLSKTIRVGLEPQEIGIESQKLLHCWRRTISMAAKGVANL